MTTSVELRQERTRVVEQMRELVDRAENESRDLSAEERQSYDRGREDFDALTGRIQRQEEQEARELETARPIPHPDDPEGRGGGNPGSGRAYRDSDLPEDAPNRAERMAFLDLARYGRSGLSPEARALVEDTAGEILVPEALESEIVRALPALTIIRDIASQRTINTNRVRRRSLDEVTVGWGKLETGTQTLTDSMPSTPGEEWTYVEDLYGLAKVGEDELDDTDVNLEEFIRDSFSRALAEAEDTGFTVGAGHASEEPVGILTDTDVARLTGGTDAAVTLDDFIKLIFEAPPQARRNGRFVMSSATELAVSLLKDANDQYLWQPSNQVGQPNTLKGHPVHNQEDVPEIPAAGSGTTNDVAIFGDFQLGYRVYDRLGMRLKRLEELYAEDGMIGFKVRRRVGGDVRRAAALKVLEVTASV